MLVRISSFALFFLVSVFADEFGSPNPNLFTKSELESFRDEAICFQKRTRTQSEVASFAKKCGSLLGENVNICDNVKCETIEECPPGLTLVQNIVGAGCCPGCVKFLEDGARCRRDSRLEQCANGLECKPSKGVCDVPLNQRACLRDYYKRNLFRKMGKSFHIPGEISPKILMIQYSPEMEMPQCSHKTGEYETKQRSKNKAFCVDPESGKPTFGVADFSKAHEVTCGCSNAMYEKLAKVQLDSSATGYRAKEKALENLDVINTDHFEDTHIKCTSAGDFHQMQCINETCLCLHEGSGVPLTTLGDFTTLTQKLDLLNLRQKGSPQDSSKSKKNGEDTTEVPPTADPEKLNSKEVRSSAVAIFGAFKALPCFDLERAKIVGSNHSRSVYIEECQKQIQTSMFIQKHFLQKGTSVRGLELTNCGSDDRFARRQCLTDQCRCSDPYGSSIGSYGVDLAKAETMDCRCALEEYFVTNERKAFDRLHCDGVGNFSPLQCIGGRSCYCADENGMPISNEFNFECVNVFIRDHAPGYNLLTLCSAMRGTLTNQKDVYKETVEMFYNAEHKSYEEKPPLPNSLNQIFC